MIRPSISGVLAAGALLLGATLSAPVSMDIAAASESDRVTGHQEFLLISTNPEEESGGPIAATGPIHARGVDKVVNNHTDLFKFPGGDVTLKHKPKKGSSNESFDPVTCLFTFTEKGTWKASEGTGTYANVEGKGTYKVVGLGIGCDENKPPEVFSLTIKAKGNLSY